MARLPCSCGVSCHLSWHRVLSLGNRRTSEDHPGVHHGQPQTGCSANCHVAVRVVSICNPHTGRHSRNVPVRDTVLGVGNHLVLHRHVAHWSTDGTVDLSTETCQHQWRKSIRASTSSRCLNVTINDFVVSNNWSWPLLNPMRIFRIAVLRVTQT